MIISTFFGEVLLRPSLLIVVLVLKLLPNDVLHLLLATELFRGSTRCLPTPSPYILTAKHSLFWEQNIFEDKNTPKHPKHDEEDDEDAEMSEFAATFGCWRSSGLQCPGCQIDLS